MKTEELAATTMPNTIGMAKLSAALVQGMHPDAHDFTPSRGGTGTWSGPPPRALYLSSASRVFTG
jgi:hypothetical protein